MVYGQCSNLAILWLSLHRQRMQGNRPQQLYIFLSQKVYHCLQFTTLQRSLKGALSYSTLVTPWLETLPCSEKGPPSRTAHNLPYRDHPLTQWQCNFLVVFIFCSLVSSFSCTHTKWNTSFPFGFHQAWIASQWYGSSVWSTSRTKPSQLLALYIYI